VCPLINAWNRGVETTHFAFSSQPCAVVVVAEVLKRKNVTKLDYPEHGVRVAADGVIRVRPDPVGATPPELAEMVRLYADGTIGVGMNGMPYGWITHIIR
jgi:hypothetical protein